MLIADVVKIYVHNLPSTCAKNCGSFLSVNLNMKVRDCQGMTNFYVGVLF